MGMGSNQATPPSNVVIATAAYRWHRQAISRQIRRGKVNALRINAS